LNLAAILAVEIRAVQIQLGRSRYGTRRHLGRRAQLSRQEQSGGHEAFFYHSREGLEVVGVVTVSVSGITDPTDPDGKWAAVKIKPKARLAQPVTLSQIKADPRLTNCELIRLGRLSVAEFTEDEWNAVIDLGKGLAKG
jgi:predicted RNA-binding protein with PUA-like domain